MFWVGSTGMCSPIRSGSLEFLLWEGTPLLSTCSAPVARGAIVRFVKVTCRKNSRQGFVGAAFLPCGLTEYPKAVTSASWTAGHLWPVTISHPTTQIIIESENRKPLRTEYKMVIWWACRPSLRKTDSYLHYRVPCLWNTLESFFQRTLYAQGEGEPISSPTAWGLPLQLIFRLSDSLRDAPCRLTHPEMVWVCGRILSMFKLWSKLRALEILNLVYFLSWIR